MLALREVLIAFLVDKLYNLEFFIHGKGDLEPIPFSTTSPQLYD